MGNGYRASVTRNEGHKSLHPQVRDYGKPHFSRNEYNKLKNNLQFVVNLTSFSILAVYILVLMMRPQHSRTVGRVSPNEGIVSCGYERHAASAFDKRTLKTAHIEVRF